jgi:hypothetical protein
MSRRTVGSFIAMALAVSVLALSPAVAKKPVMDRYEDSFTFFIPRGELCGFGIRVRGHVEGKAIIFEESRNTFRATFHERLTATWTNVRSHKSILEKERYNIFVDETRGDGTVTFTGIPFRFQPVHGGHFIIKDRGRVVFDVATGELIFEAGPHPSLHGQGTEELCAALS